MGSIRVPACGSDRQLQGGEIRTPDVGSGHIVVARPVTSNDSSWPKLLVQNGAGKLPVEVGGSIEEQVGVSWPVGFTMA